MFSAYLSCSQNERSSGSLLLQHAAEGQEAIPPSPSSWPRASSSFGRHPLLQAAPAYGRPDVTRHAKAHETRPSPFRAAWAFFLTVLSTCSLCQDGMPERSFPLVRPHGVACTYLVPESFSSSKTCAHHRAFSVSPRPTAGRPWAPAVAQEAQGRFRLTPLCEFSPLCYGYRTPPL